MTLFIDRYLLFKVANPKLKGKSDEGCPNRKVQNLLLRAMLHQ